MTRQDILFFAIRVRRGAEPPVERIDLGRARINDQGEFECENRIVRDKIDRMRAMFGTMRAFIYFANGDTSAFGGSELVDATEWTTIPSSPEEVQEAQQREEDETKVFLTQGCPAQRASTTTLRALFVELVCKVECANGCTNAGSLGAAPPEAYG
jgi:hypothetical protein